MRGECPDLIAPRDGGEKRHGAFCFGHAAHAFRTWGVLNSSWGVLVLVMGRFAASPGGAAFPLPAIRRCPMALL